MKTIRIGKILGQSTSHILVTATIPLARPAIIVGASLVLMEVLADYGTVSFFGINILSKVVFDLWLNMNDLAAASQLSLIVLFLSFSGQNDGAAEPIDSLCSHWLITRKKKLS